MINENADPKEDENQDNGGQSRISPKEEEKVEDNDVQRGLTGESDDEEDVGGDLAGNAGGNT